MIEKTLPRSFSWMAKSTAARGRPDQIVSEFQTGGRMVRDFGTRNLRNYSLDLSIFPSDSDKLDELEAFLEDVRIQGSPFWLTEPESRIVREAPLWPAPDGVRTTFIRPFLGSAAVTLEVFVGGLADAGSYTEHAETNFLTEDQANAVDSITGLNAFGTCTIARSTALAAVGRTCIKVNPSSPYTGTGAQTDPVALPASMTTAYNDVTGHAAIRGKGAFKITVETLDAGSGVITSATDTVSGDPTRWVIVAATATAPPALGITQARITVEKTSTDANDFFLGALAISPGDLDYWFPPGDLVTAIEFGNAPPAESEPSASGTGYPVTRVRMETSSPGWRFHGAGHHYPGSIDLVEEFE